MTADERETGGADRAGRVPSMPRRPLRYLVVAVFGIVSGLGFLLLATTAATPEGPEMAAFTLLTKVLWTAIGVLLLVAGIGLIRGERRLGLDLASGLLLGLPIVTLATVLLAPVRLDPGAMGGLVVSAAVRLLVSGLLVVYLRRRPAADWFDAPARASAAPTATA